MTERAFHDRGGAAPVRTDRRVGRKRTHAEKLAATDELIAMQPLVDKTWEECEKLLDANTEI